MRKALAVLAAGVLASLLSAAPVCQVGDDVLVQGYECQLGPLVFSNFWQSLGPSSILIGEATATAGEVFLGFNPGMLSNIDFWFSFMVTGPHVGADLDLLWGSVGATVVEDICADAACTTKLLQLVASSGQRVEGYYPTPVSVVYVKKDIGVGGSSPGTPDGYFAAAVLAEQVPPSHLSRFGQSFIIIPEPMTLVLIGSGLLGLGLLRRRAARS